MRNVIKLPRLNNDPFVVAFGMMPCDTLQLHAEKFGGRSSGCGFRLQDGYIGTVGETVERYCPAFYDKEKLLVARYKDIANEAINPKEFALFHEKQYESYIEKKYRMYPFNENIELHWEKCLDLTNGDIKYVPAACVYLPWTIEKQWITVGTSTGLAAHTNYYKALLTGLYEIIERDSFVITWHQQIFRNKIIIDEPIQNYIHSKFPVKYEWHFFDITYDIDMPTMYGICFGEAEYGKFVAVGTATRSTKADALRKVILEISQSVSYFRYLLGEKKGWMPDDDLDKLLNFEDHSIFYIKKPENQHVFDIWRNAPATNHIDFTEKETKPANERVKEIVKLMKDKNYNVLVKDLTTPDVNQAGFYCLRVIIPQLLQMGGAYPFYFLGSNRLYEVPKIIEKKSRSFDELNHFPHPFP